MIWRLVMNEKIFKQARTYKNTVYGPQVFISFDKAGELSEEDMVKSIVYAMEECDKTNPKIHTDMTKRRSLQEIFLAQLIGKLGEFATYEAIKQSVSYSPFEEPDIHAWERGIWDKGDLIVINNKTNKKELWQIKTPVLSYSQFLLLETGDYNKLAQYIHPNHEDPIEYDGFVFQRIRYDEDQHQKDDNNSRLSNIFEKFFEYRNKFVNNDTKRENYLVERELEKYSKQYGLDLKIEYELPRLITREEFINQVIRKSHILPKGKFFTASPRYDKHKGKTKLQDENYYIEASDMEHIN